jgi:hypothetical protein
MQSDIENWTKSTAGEMARELERATGNTQAYADGLTAIDEVNGDRFMQLKRRARMRLRSLTDENMHVQETWKHIRRSTGD